jgi:hypothetical protein
VAKDHHLDVAVQSIGGASDKLDQAAQQQVDEREEHGGNLPGEKRPDPTTSLAATMITGFCALQPESTRVDPTSKWRWCLVQGVTAFCRSVDPVSIPHDVESEGY